MKNMIVLWNPERNKHRFFYRNFRKICFFINFFTAFFLIEVFFFHYFSQPPKIKPKISKRYANQSICKEIKFINNVQDTITIDYKVLPSIDPDLINSHFALITYWKEQEIVFPLGSADIISNDSHSITIQFPFPVADNYDSTFYCSFIPYDHYPSSKIIKENSIKSQYLMINSQEFPSLYFSKKYSKFRCHGNDYATRYCEFSNLGFMSYHTTFFSPAYFHFPIPFLVPGARAPPFGRQNDNLVYEPLIIHRTINNFTGSLSIEKRFSYFYGIFHNIHMPWHFFFDFMIPLYNFVHYPPPSVYTETNRSNSLVLIKYDSLWGFENFMNIFSVSPILNLNKIVNNFIFKRGIIGVPKLETNPDPNRPYSDSYFFTYNFTRNTAFGMREKVLNVFNMTQPELHDKEVFYEKQPKKVHLNWVPRSVADEIDTIDGKPGEKRKPLVVLIDRGDSPRNIKNNDEILTVIKEECPFCNVHRMIFQKMSIEDQVNVISKSVVLIGLHGSGLANVIWMAESRVNRTTHLIEILPYMYNCRNWYQTAAEVAGVQYHSVMNSKPNPDPDGQLQYCYKHPEQCPTMNCHEILRDQPVRLEKESFVVVFQQIVNQLKNDWNF